jgi:hypothetical protein
VLSGLGKEIQQLLLMRWRIEFICVYNQSNGNDIIQGKKYLMIPASGARITYQ